ncbi:MAG: hypothetical protein CMG60_06395 [Candidatus Marinimicrobia bacterium]|nr:hypothetical protein [Candidatus Neomarinimicrobiota bacterium]
MLNKFKLIFFLSLLFGAVVNLKPSEAKFFDFLGIKFRIVKNGDSPNRYIWIHGDEKTARMALEDHLDLFEGTAFFIENDEREIPFETTIIDPNRIFSRNGAYHTLRKFKPNWEIQKLNAALDYIHNEKVNLIQAIKPTKKGLLISVHNNSRGYNVYREKDKSQAVSIKSGQNPRDFIICTDKNDFEILSSGPYNVVLQNELPDKDDGSLSWEAIRLNIRYLNIETRLGYRTKQRKILEFVEKNLN